MNFHLKIPRERVANLKMRLRVLQRCRQKAKYRRAVLEACKQDLLFWINLFVWQYNPNSIGPGSPELGPFITWKFQEDALLTMAQCVHKRKNVVIEKSREMGATWMCLLLFAWLYLFHPWKKFLAMSRNAEAVDRPGDPDCLFWKLDFIFEHLPSWMIDGRIQRRKMSFYNPTTKSSITGQASTGKAGVGGRCTAMFVDEFSRIDEDWEVLQQTASTTDCRIFNFTHFGLDSAAYATVEAIKEGNSSAELINLHWTQHPDKWRGAYRFENNKVEVLDTTHAYPEDFEYVMTGKPSGGFAPGVRSPWYDAKVQEIGNDRGVAMDLDIDPAGSVEQVFNAIMIRQLIAAHAVEPYWKGEFFFDEDLGKPIKMERKEMGKFYFWVHFTPDGFPPLGTYVIAADVSQGSGASNSCVTILNAETGEKVCEYADPHIEPKRLGSLCVALCWLFKGPDGVGAKLAWEIPGPGQTLGAHVTREIGYTNIYFRKGHDLNETATVIPGWASSAQSKQRLLNEYQAALLSRKFLNRSKLALEECLKFKYTPSGTMEHSGESSSADPSGARVNHGDRVIPDALAWLLAKEVFVGRKSTVKKNDAPLLSLAWRRSLRAERDRAEDAWS